MIGDLESNSGFESIPSDIDISYFLVHAMSDRVKNLSEVESTIANNYVKMLNKPIADKLFT